MSIVLLLSHDLVAYNYVVDPNMVQFNQVPLYRAVNAIII